MFGSIFCIETPLIVHWLAWCNEKITNDHDTTNISRVESCTPRLAPAPVWTFRRGIRGVAAVDLQNTTAKRSKMVNSYYLVFTLHAVHDPSKWSLKTHHKHRTLRPIQENWCDCSQFQWLEQLLRVPLTYNLVRLEERPTVRPTDRPTQTHRLSSSLCLGVSVL